MFRIFAGTLAAAGLAALSVGCSSLAGELSGTWDGCDPVGSQTNRMTLDQGLTGTARIWAYIDDDPDPLFIDFDVTAFASEDEADPRFHLECAGDCDALDFQMACRMSDGPELRCTGDGLWQSYDFCWDKRQ